ncbi:MAG: FixH family protein [Phycisphaeraceae bacterium]|nr:FixH family protein [Phycisphaeraceae bacterium]
MKSLLVNRWMFVPVILLLGNALFAFTAVRLALSDHGTAAEPDYYRRALNWDESHAARTAGERLRWTVSPSLVASATGEITLDLSIADKWGIPISEAMVRVELIPVRAADLAIRRACVESEEGRYTTAFPVRVGGQWEIRVEIERGEDRLEERFRRMLAPAAFHAPAEAGSS